MARTQIELREELLDRLNFGSQATTDVATVRLANSFLRNAQSQLYWNYDFSELRMTWSITISKWVNRYEWPTVEDDSEIPGVGNTVEPRRLISVSIQDDTRRYGALREGITPGMYDSLFTNTGTPTHYARTKKIEFWRMPDKVYIGKLDGYCKLRPFAADTDETTIDDELVFMLALANGKAHYRQPDAEVYAQEMNSLLRRLKGYDHGGRRYIPGMNDDHSAMPMPRRAPEPGP